MNTRSAPDAHAITGSDSLLVVEKLYEAALDTASWSGFIDFLAGLLSCVGGQYLAFDQLTGRLTASVFSGFHAEDINRRYLQHWSPHDPRLTILPGADSGDWASYHQVLNKGGPSTGRFYQDFLNPAGIRHMTVFCGTACQGIVPVLTLFQSAEDRPFSGEASIWLEGLRPHFTRALRLHVESRQLRRESAGLRLALNTLDYPALLIQDGGVVVFGNRAAQEWLANSAHMHMKDRQLKARSSEGNACLALLLQAVRNRRCEVLTLRCPEGGKPWQIAVCPIRIDDTAGAPDTPGEDLIAPLDPCFVTVANPQAKTSLSLEHLQTLFGLTTATARVALNLAEGMSLQEIACEHGVSINTVRSQIRQVMERTGAHRQTELVRIIGALPRLKY